MKDTNAFRIYINKNSGTVLNMGQHTLEALILSSDLPIKSLDFLDAGEMFERLQNDPSDAPILIGGGDGTIRSCAEICLKKDQAFGILPLGTMNLLAKDLGLPVQLDNVVQGYARKSQELRIDVGSVNDEVFLCCVGLGTMPEASEYREKQRGDSQPVLIPRMTAYVLRQMDRANRRKVTLHMDGAKRAIKTSALVISNNQYDPHDQWSVENFKRPSLRDGVFGVYSAAPYSTWDKLRLLFKLSVGGWKNDAALSEWSARDLSISGKESKVLLSLDGETMHMSMPLNFQMKPRALRVIIPVEGTGEYV